MELTTSAFARLRGLLRDVPRPPGVEPIPLHLGESRLSPPTVDPTPLAEAGPWGSYPPLGGTEELRQAYLGWLRRRFGLSPRVFDDRMGVEPTPGTKQAVSVAITLAVLGARDAGDRPVVVLPNPFYPSYHAATVAVGAQPRFYTLDDPGDVTPVVAAVREAGDRTAAVVVCNPGNPRGEVLDEEALRRVAHATAAARALLIVDECYVDLFTGAPPPGFLPLAAAGAVPVDRFLVLHSLSKRSAAPGLRSGFAAGDPATVGGYAAYNRACGVSSPLPVCAAAAALWSDEEHVTAARRTLAHNWDLADAALAPIPGYRRAQAGLFLWLPVTDDEVAARQLWRDQAVSVMPGRYLGATGPDGVNPGVGYLRVALGHPTAVMREALARLRRVLAPPAAHVSREAAWSGAPTPVPGRRP